MIPARPPVTFADYIALPGINWSSLRNLRDGSPLHYRHALTHERPDTVALRNGRAVHTAILEPDRIGEDLVVFPGARRAGKDWDAFEAENTGRTIVKPNEYADIIATRDAVRGHHLAAPYLGTGVREYTIQWTDKATGLLCKARPDWLTMSADGLVLVDLKTARAIDEGGFGRQAQRLGYPCQLAHYAAGLAAIGLPVSKIVFVIVESKAPHDVGVLVMTDEQRKNATAEVADLLGRVAHCHLTDQWPGRYAAESPLVLPDYLALGDATFEEEI